MLLFTVKLVRIYHGLGQGSAYGGYGQPMSSTQPAAELLEPSQQLTQSTYQGSAASNVAGGTSGSTGNTMSGQPQTAGYVGQQALPAAQLQQQTFNPNSRFVHCISNYTVRDFSACCIYCSGMR